MDYEEELAKAIRKALKPLEGQSYIPKVMADAERAVEELLKASTPKIVVESFQDTEDPTLYHFRARWIPSYLCFASKA